MSNKDYERLVDYLKNTASVKEKLLERKEKWSKVFEDMMDLISDLQKDDIIELKNVSTELNFMAIKLSSLYNEADANYPESYELSKLTAIENILKD